MKKGISLIVLVITIIVMIIIAGAIIISLNSTNLIERANQATRDSNLAELRSAVALAYANLYTDYLADVADGTATKADAPKAEDVLAASVDADTTVQNLLDAINKNTEDVTYEIVDGTSGVIVREAKAST